MKKIPTLFERIYENHKIVGITPKITEGMEWVLSGEGTATLKIDGSCCCIINNKFYKRYDAKKGKPIPKGAIKCQDEADTITGHLPCWIEVDFESPADKWFVKAYENTPSELIKNGTYEAIGEHFQGNPYDLCGDILERHGTKVIDVERTFEGIKKYLSENYIEGIVFWKDGEPKCKIKRSDFGLDWK